MLTQILQNIKNVKKDNIKCRPHNFYNTSLLKKPCAYKSINSSSVLSIRNFNIINQLKEKN
jgi:hypothetical protein